MDNWKHAGARSISLLLHCAKLGTLLIVTLCAGCGGGGGGGDSGGSSGSGGSGSATGSTTGSQHTYSYVEFDAPSNNQIVALQTQLIVPAEPPASGTLFLWPGLQPDGANFDPINNGVLQPVLTWGPSCAPGVQPAAFSTWWISAQYVNTAGNATGYTGCEGGSVMPVNVGDTLSISMTLTGTVWLQNIVDVQTGKSVSFSIDMLGQSQNYALFAIEGYGQSPVSNVVFGATTITLAQPDTSACSTSVQDLGDVISGARVSADGLSCIVDGIVLSE